MARSRNPSSERIEKLEYIAVTDMLQDEHILELSGRITDGEELYNFGINGLGLPESEIKRAMYDHSISIQSATHKLLSKFMERQTNRHQAYINLYSALKEGQMEQLAGLVKRMVEGLVDTSPVSDAS